MSNSSSPRQEWTPQSLLRSRSGDSASGGLRRPIVTAVSTSPLQPTEKKSHHLDAAKSPNGTRQFQNRLTYFVLALGFFIGSKVALMMESTRDDDDYTNNKNNIVQPLKNNVPTANANTITTAVRSKSQNINKNNKNNGGLVVDIVSVGSNLRMDLLEAQFELYQSHASVRTVFNVTEDDDYDQACHSELNNTDAIDVSWMCKDKTGLTNGYARKFALYFATKKFLERRSNPIGWLCSQPRPMIGLVKVLSTYKEQLLESNSDNQDSVLPDYLMVLDDDTYINMNIFESYFSKEKELNNNNNKLGAQPIVTAGCVVRFPMDGIHFMFPWGGFGAYYNRQAIEKLLKPIHCPGDDPEICQQILERNFIQEKASFQNGMSVIDLVAAYIRNRPFSGMRHISGKKEALEKKFCFHSDWFQGYMIIMYNISKHEDSKKEFWNVSQERLHRYADSTVYGERKRGQCLNDGKCSPSKDLACHHLNATFLRDILHSQQTVLSHDDLQ